MPIVRNTATTLLVATLMGAAQPALAQETQISTRFVVEVAGVDLIKVTHSISITGDTYRTAISAKTTGVANWISDYKISMSSDGALMAGTAQPASFTRERKKKGKWRGSSTTWSGGTPAITPDNGGDFHEAMAGAVNASTLDPLTLLVRQSLSSSDNPCSGKSRIFDGRDVFDAVLSGKAGDEAGTIRCRVTLNYVAGREVEEARPNKAKSYSYNIIMKAVAVASLGRRVWLPDSISGSFEGKNFVARATERGVQ